MSSNNHDTLVYRLAQMLIKLNQGESLDPLVLSNEFGVNVRTIQRDLNERFAYLPLVKAEGNYRLDPAYLGRITFRDIERFASLAGLQGMFPALTADFLRELFDSRLQETLSIHGPSYEDLQHRLNEFRSLQQAINQKRIVQFRYTKENGSKVVTVSPYRLINHSGVWYLAAVDSDKPKAYAFGKISALVVSESTFHPEPSIHAMLDSEDSIWINEKKTEVVLTVAPVAAIYFQRRKLIAQQIIEKELEDGGLIVSGKFAHPNQILPIIRYWMPHIRIVSPEAWQAELDACIQSYLSH